MSFRAKLLLCVLLLVTIALDTCLLLVVKQSTQLNLSRERARALGEHYQLGQTASAQLDMLPQNADVLNTLPLVHNRLVRGHAGVNLFWYVEGQSVLDNAGMPVPASLIQADGQRRTAVSGEWLLAASGLSAPYEKITLVSATSLLPLIEMNRQLTRQMLITAFIASALLLGLSWLMLSGLLAPVARLSHAMCRAMSGDFSARVKAQGHNELADLSEGFNHMAQRTQRHIAELNEAAERNQRFSDDMAHEMRTPVTAIGGYARSLLEQPLDEHDRRKALQYIASESVRMQKMSEALLILTGLRQDSIELQAASVRQMFDHAIQATSLELSARDLLIVSECKLDSLICDAALIESVLINLIVNSARASAHGQGIGLHAGMRGEIPYLLVRDYGRGMTREQIARATQPFYRTDKARARSDGGAGLGLALVQRIVEAHGAMLYIDSAPDQGTIVRIEFTAALHLVEYADTAHPLQCRHDERGIEP